MHKFRKHGGQEPPWKLCELCDLTCLTTGGLRFHQNTEHSKVEGLQEFKCALCDSTALKITPSIKRELESGIFSNIIAKNIGLV